MAVYNKLLLSADGGIINLNKQSEQAEQCATLAIGLGGTGCDCLRNLKAKVYNRIKPDDPDAEVPGYRRIKFLAVDSDKGKLKKDGDKSYGIDNAEFLDISADNIIETFQGQGDLLNMRAEMKDWLRCEDISIATATDGAGGVRQVGRFLLIDKADQFFNKVHGMINDILSGLKTPAIYIHIFAGIGGGTGSGTFLDACYLVKEVLKRVGKLGNAKVFGYFFLPDVNLSSAPDEATQNYIRMNGYAALKELDYCMNFERNGDAWKQVYSAKHTVRSNEIPVDLCRLITATDSGGNVISDAYDYALNVTAEYVLDFLVKEQLVSTDQSMGIASHISNFNAKKKMIQKDHGAGYGYLVLGAAAAQIPMKEILTYLVSALFKGFENITDLVPTEREAEEFAETNGLTYEQLIGECSRGADANFEPPDFAFKDVHADGNQVMIGALDKMLGSAKGSVETNIKAMSHPLDDYKDTARIDSVVCRIFNALKRLIQSPEHGPIYAAGMLDNANGKDLRDIIDGLIAENGLRLKRETDQRDLRTGEYERTETEFFGKKPNARRYQNYVTMTRELYKHRYWVDVHWQLGTFLEGLKKEIENLSVGYTSVLKDLVRSLVETFRVNRQYLDALPPANDPYVMQLVTVRDVKGSLDTVIKQMDMPGQVKRFMEFLTKETSSEIWRRGRENDIAKLVTDYFNGVFAGNAEKTLSGYLEDKYQETNASKLADIVHNEIIVKLDAMAAPLFWTAGFYPIDNGAQLGYCSVPASAPAILAAAQKLVDQNKQELSLRATEMQDRITFLRFVVGVPVYGYRPLAEYENFYAGKTDFVGRHLHEGKNGGKDWENLPSPIPFSLMQAVEDVSPKTRERAEAAAALYDRAETAGVIAADGNGYGVRVTEDGFYADAVASIKDAIGSAEILRMQKALEDVTGEKEGISGRALNVLPIPNDGTGDDGVKARVRKDHFVASPILQEAAENELRKMTPLEEALAKLEEKIRYVEDRSKSMKSFTDGLFSGIFTVSVHGANINYLVEESDTGIQHEGELSKPTTEPFGGIPLYQAFESYRQLSYDLKGMIDEETKRRMDANDSAISDALSRVHSLLTPEYMNRMRDTAKANHPSEYDDIMNFLPDIRRRLNSFAALFGVELAR
ncbi:MAG: tubulin-like doman-containing protein [Clostridiales Family XIII bacterium]|jgi:hypothetical protein|nr:tubulin-like doman-containing protein [Clostridiales Family XIII bacterium]